MINPKHIVKRVNKDYRLIVISDIHGHLDRFLMLLKKVNYNEDEDFLVILGDFVEKGDQVIETIHYIQKLSLNERVFVLAGNCEWALEALLTIPEIAKEIPNYLKRVPKNGCIRTIYNRLHLDDGHETALGVQREIEAQLHNELRFISTLPITLKFNDFLFVHAGLEKRDNYKECGLSSYLEMQGFYELGHNYKEIVVVGHIPTSNYDKDHINNDCIIDLDKRIICIDGGTGVKNISQLNALIIESKDSKISYKQECIRPLKTYKVIKEIHPIKQQDFKIAYPNFRIHILEKGDEFSLCRQLDTKEEFYIKNEFIYYFKSQYYCLDDYTTHQLDASIGDDIQLLGIYGQYAYGIINEQIGWILLNHIMYTA